MKKKSLKDLNGLKKSGYKISEADRAKVAKAKTAKALNEGIQAIGESIGSMESTIKENKVPIDSLNDTIERTSKHNANAIMTTSMAVKENTREITKILKDGLTGIRSILLEDKEWEFEVKRNDDGFISKVFVKQVE